MKKWYTSKTLLNTLIAVMIVGFIGFLFPHSSQTKLVGIIVFLTAGTLIMVRGVVKITMGMWKNE